jgi:hypothetical protein
MQSLVQKLPILKKFPRIVMGLLYFSMAIAVFLLLLVQNINPIRFQK